MKKYTLLILTFLTSVNSQAIINGTPRPEKIEGSVYERVGNLQDNVRGTFCKGLLIAPRIIISAAHCSIDLSLTTEFVLIDQNNVKKFYDVLHVEVPKAYSLKEEYNFGDIAVIILQKPVEGKTRLKEVRLLSEPLKEGDQGTFYGGRHDFTDKLRFLSENSKPHELQSATLLFDGTSPFNNDHYILRSANSGNPKESKLCFRDSGGPYIVEQNGVTYLAGIASSLLRQKDSSSDDQNETDFEYCMASFPHITSVPFYFSWLQRTIQKLGDQYALELPKF